MSSNEEREAEKGSRVVRSASRCSSLTEELLTIQGLTQITQDLTQMVIMRKNKRDTQPPMLTRNRDKINSMFAFRDKLITEL